MTIKRIFTLLLALLMTLSCFAGVVVVSAEETDDPFAAENEELMQMYRGEKTDNALGGYGVGASFGASVTVPEDKRLTQINILSLATYNNNVNQIVFRVYQWNTDYATTVAGEVLTQVSKFNHHDNEPIDVVLPTNRNLTGELLWTATYVTGESKMTPWKAEGAVGNAVYYAQGKECDPFCFSVTVADELTALPASYTATFVADGVEVSKTTFYEGDTELLNIPECPAKEGFYADWATYTLGTEDITIEAIYTDASNAVKDAIPDAANVTAFAENHSKYLKPEGCLSKINRDGTATFTGAWGIDDEIDAYVNIDYCNYMMKYFEGYDSRNDLPNKSHQYNVIAFKVKAPAVAADSTPNLTVIAGRNIEIYGVKVANEIKCDGTEEYWIFDFSDHADFSSNFVNTMKLNWAYSDGTEENLGSEFVLMGFRFFDTYEDAVNAANNDTTPDETPEDPEETLEEGATQAPGEAPDDKPEDKPADTSAEKPEDKPADTSADKPADTSADKPADSTAETSKGASNEKPEGTAAEGATAGAEGTDASDESGCSSVLGAAAVIMTAVAAAVVLKKKD